MLFNLAEDIGEQQDLATQRPEKLKEVQSAFAEWEKGTMPAQWVRQDARNAELGGKLKDQPTPRGRRGGANLQGRFNQLDRNGDGKLSKDEVPNAQLFQRMDANGDGEVTMDEARQAFAGRRRRAATQ
jgi:hypothetical protein